MKLSKAGNVSQCVSNKTATQIHAQQAISKVNLEEELSIAAILQGISDEIEQGSICKYQQTQQNVGTNLGNLVRRKARNVFEKFPVNRAM